MVVAVVIIIHTLHLSPCEISSSGCCYQFPFYKEETELRELGELPKVTELLCEPLGSVCKSLVTRAHMCQTLFSAFIGIDSLNFSESLRDRCCHLCFTHTQKNGSREE